MLLSLYASAEGSLEAVLAGGTFSWEVPDPVESIGLEAWECC